MKLETLSQEQLETLIKNYDHYVSYIDDGAQYREAQKSNENIVKILAYFGYDLDLSRIEPKIERKYKYSNYTTKDLEHAIKSSKETIERVQTSKYVEDVAASVEKFSKVQVLELVPVLKTVNNCSWIALEEIVVNVIDVRSL